MNLGFNTKARAIFVDTDSPVTLLDGKVNIILSPALYWVKRVSLPVKYLHEVKPLIPSLFEDQLPEGKYSYTAYKDGEDFLIFAYNDKEILDLITSKEINSANINNIYLAQSEFKDLQAPVRISENSILSVQDGVVVKLPALLAPDAPQLDLSEHHFSKQAIHLTRFNQIADKRSQVIFASILIFLIVMFATEWLITASKVDNIMEKQAAVFSEHNLQSTFFQNEAIQAKLNAIFERQTRIREIFNLALTIKLKDDEQMQQIVLEKNKIVIAIKTPSEARGQKSLSKLQKRFKRTKTRFDNGTYIMEISI